MALYTVKEYAKLNGVSYEAVRKQLKQYEKDLAGHVTKQGRTYVLDDKAVEILNVHRAKRNLIIEQPENELTAEIERLRRELNYCKDQVIKLQNDKNILLEEKNKYIEDKTQNATLLMIADKEHDELLQARQELTETKQELNRYTKTIFGLYRKS